MINKHAINEKFYKKRRFFLYYNNDFHFMLLIKMFSTINRKHFAKIFKSIFISKQFFKFVNDYTIKNVLNIDLKNNFIDVDIKDLIYLNKNFEIYCQIILELALFFEYKKLNKTFFIYKCRLYMLFKNHIFEFVFSFHKIFMYSRIS